MNEKDLHSQIQILEKQLAELGKKIKTLESTRNNSEIGTTDYETQKEELERKLAEITTKLEEKLAKLNAIPLETRESSQKKNEYLHNLVFKSVRCILWTLIVIFVFLGFFLIWKVLKWTLRIRAMPQEKNN